MLFSLFARVGLVSLVNTTVGVSIFPILKTAFPVVHNTYLIIFSHITCLLLSFLMHGKITFRSNLSFIRLLYFCIVNVLSLVIMIGLVKTLVKHSGYDVRLVQPAIALFMQFIIVFFYKAIFWGKLL